MGVIYGSVENIKLYEDGYGDGDGSGYGSGSGYEDGSGYGYEDGSGYGSGYGSGSGYEDGSGYGYEDGSGYGSGYEDGSGYGSGYGYGYGYEDGDGSGYGSGAEAVAYQEAVIACSVGERGERLREQGVVLAFWRSAKDGTPANGGSGPARQIGMVEELSGRLEPCTRNALHATLQPRKWKGERLWIVALYPPVVHVDEDKIASLKREIIAEVPNWFE